MTVTKTEVCKMMFYLKGKDLSNNNFGNFMLSLNRLLYNCIIKEIIPYETLKMREKLILNKILEGKHNKMFFCKKTKQIRVFPSGKTNQDLEK